MNDHAELTESNAKRKIEYRDTVLSLYTVGRIN